MASTADNSGVINRAMITATVMLATLMQALDTTIANVALPYMQGSLSATSDQIDWVLTSYIVAAAIITPATGWLEARFGRKPLFLTAVIGFIVTSMMCGAAVSLSQIVVFRLLQGIFGAPLVPLSQSVLLDAYPPEQQGQAMAVFGLGVMLGPILGPTLGGWLTDSYSWRWCSTSTYRSACCALSASYCSSDGAATARWLDGSIGSDLRRSASASRRCSCSWTVASGSTGSPRARSSSRPHSACSAFICSRSTQ
jgi:MFS family permease